MLASSMPDAYCAVLAKMNDQGSTQAEVEEELVGIFPRRDWGLLAGNLGINDLVVEAIAHHHPTRVSHSDLDCSIAVYLADLLAHELEIHANDRRERRAPCPRPQGPGDSGSSAAIPFRSELARSKR